ncbi:DUF494 family protein [Candidatus Zixiibacteriota bacterium]
MRNKILEIVIFLMDYMRDNYDNDGASDDASHALKDLGYSEYEIDSAYDWFLDQFNPVGEQHYSEFPGKNSSSRVLTETERIFINAESYGFLLKLLHHHLITDEQLEKIIERIMIIALDKKVTIDQIKMIASSVIFSDYDSYDLPDMFDQPQERLNRLN